MIILSYYKRSSWPGAELIACLGWGPNDNTWHKEITRSPHKRAGHSDISAIRGGSAFLMIRFLCGAADSDGDDESFLAAVAATVAAAPPLQAAVAAAAVAAAAVP